MHPRNQISIVLILISFGLLIPGVTLPVFDLGVDVAVASNLASLKAHVLDETRSILGTIQDLYSRDRILVASLILLFSVVVPVIKGLVLLAALPLKSNRIQLLMIDFVHAIGKWSMADVFVVAVFLVYLSTNNNVSTTQESINVFGMKLPLEIRMLMDSDLGPGFYWFLGYCVLSLVTLHVIKKPQAG
jgi:hypothetical protein